MNPEPSIPPSPPQGTEAGDLPYDSLPLRTLLRAARHRPGGGTSGCELVLGLLHTDRHIRNHFLRLMAERGLNEYKFATLVSLFALDPMRPTSADLAFHSEVSRSAMTEILDQLEERRWIVRHRHLEDRRIIQIEITELGRQVTSDAMRAFVDAADALTQGLPSTLREATLDTCSKLYGRSNPAPASTPFITR